MQGKPRGTTRRPRRAAGSAVAALALLACAAAPVSAAEDGAARSKESYVVSPRTHRALARVHELIDEERYDAARGALDKLARRRKLSDHERALLHQTYGHVHASLEDYPRAVERLEACLALDALPESTELSTRYNLAQLYMALERYPDAADLLRRWIERVEHPTPHAYYLLAAAYTQQELFREALGYAVRAVEGSKEPAEAWLELLLMLQLEHKNYRAGASLLERLIPRVGKKHYWIQLAGVYSELRREADALAVLQLCYEQGYLQTDGELRNLAQLYLYQQLPYQAAQLLSAELTAGRLEADAEAWELLANAWLYAQEEERALEPLRKAAGAASDGNLYVRLAQIYLDAEAWTEAESTLGKALEKGALQRPGETQLLLGIARYNRKQFRAAESAFRAAQRHPSQRKSATQWLRLIDRERAAAAR